MSEMNDLLAKSGLPEAAIAPIRAKLEEAQSLIREHNARVLSVKAAKSADPNNVENLDAAWRANLDGDSEIDELEPRFQAVTAEYEKLLAALREKGKKQIKPPLSEDEQRKTRNLINESAATIAKVRSEAETFSSLVDGMLVSQGVETSIMSVIPDVESLKGGRGRKSGSGSIGTNMTRVADILVDGESTNKDGRGKFNFAAQRLSAMFDAGKVPQNEVDPEALEEAYFASLGFAFRDKTVTLPDSHSFEFTKDVAKQNPNDDSFTTAPVTKTVTVVRPASKAKTESESKEENLNTENTENKENAKPAAKKTTAKK